MGSVSHKTNTGGDVYGLVPLESQYRSNQDAQFGTDDERTLKPRTRQTSGNLGEREPIEVALIEEELIRLWKGSPWCPPDVEMISMPAPHEAMLEVTNSALKQGLELETLWETNGYFREVMNVQNVPKLSVGLCKTVLGILESPSGYQNNSGINATAKAGPSWKLDYTVQSGDRKKLPDQPRRTSISGSDCRSLASFATLQAKFPDASSSNNVHKSQKRRHLEEIDDSTEDEKSTEEAAVTVDRPTKKACKSVPSTPPQGEANRDNIPLELVSFIKKAISSGTLEQLKRKLMDEEGCIEEIYEALLNAKLALSYAEWHQETTERIYDNVETQVRQCQVASHVVERGLGQRKSNGNIGAIVVNFQNELSDSIRSKFADEVTNAVSRCGLDELKVATRAVAKHHHEIKILSKRKKRQETQLAVLRRRIDILEIHDEIKKGIL